MRSNLFDFWWSLNAAAAAGRMKDIGHSWPWLIDALADVCRGWLPETDLPRLLRQWKRTDTSHEPCSFRGIDWEMHNMRAEAGGKSIAISALRSDADFNAVMRYPELVLSCDWPALARETGVYTNEKHLRDLVKRCFEKSLTEAALTERGLQQLLARLRVTDGGTAPRRLLPLATAPSTDLGVRGPLPLLNGATGATGQMEIRHDLGTTAAPTSEYVSASALAEASTDASANASALGSTKASAPVPKSASTKKRSAAYLQRQANTKRTQYAASRGAAYKARDSESQSKERRAQQKRDKYAAARGDAYKPRASARGPREGSQARPSKRQRTQPDGEVVGSGS